MFKNMPSMIYNAETICHIGKIENIVGMTIEASGGKAAIGDICHIYSDNTHSTAPQYQTAAESTRWRLSERAYH